MDPSLTRTLDTLRTAQDALRSEMDVWAEAGVVDKARLRQLREAARSFREQAHSLLVMMAYEDAPEDLQQELEALIVVFGDTAAQIEAMLGSGQRGT